MSGFKPFDLTPSISLANQSRALAEMNRRHAVVRDAGSTLVISSEFDPAMQREQLVRSTFADIANFYKQAVQVGDDNTEPLGKWWLSNPNRRQFSGLVFDPSGIRTPPDYFNTWGGFAVAPAKGDWSLLEMHLFEVVCNGDANLFNYVMGWLAHGVQHPEERPEVALVLRSESRGTGKSLPCRFYRQLFGRHGVEISNPLHLTGRFNAHLEDACLLVLNEAFWAGSHQGEAVLKAIITDDLIAVERKGYDTRLVPNHLRVVMTSNAEWVVPAGADERRFLILDVSDARKQDTAYFGAMVAQMEKQGGLAAMLYDLQRFNINSIDLRRVPKTVGLLEQKIHSLDPRDRWLFEKLVDGRLLHGDSGWCAEVEKDLLHIDYAEHVRNTGVRRTQTATELGIFLQRTFGSSLSERRPTRGAQRVRTWVLPSLDEARAIFERRLGSSYPWPLADESSARRSRVASMPSESLRLVRRDR